jgi:hypothetical protein
MLPCASRLTEITRLQTSYFESCLSWPTSSQRTNPHLRGGSRECSCLHASTESERIIPKLGRVRNERRHRQDERRLGTSFGRVTKLSERCSMQIRLVSFEKASSWRSLEFTRSPRCPRREGAVELEVALDRGVNKAFERSMFHQSPRQRNGVVQRRQFRILTRLFAFQNNQRLLGYRPTSD